MQVNVLKNKFIHKGYNNEVLDKTFNEVANIPCLMKKDHQSPSYQHQWGFISNFQYQYREIEEIFKKYRYILCMDRDLGPVLPNCPKFINRKAPHFGDQAVWKILDLPGQQKICLDKTGFYSCRRCISCRTVKVSNRGKTTITNMENNIFTIDKFITCNTSHVVYLLWCPCGSYYVGRMKRLLRIRIAEHVAI